MHVNKTNFHMKGFALGLALKQRRKATRKSPNRAMYFILFHVLFVALALSCYNCHSSESWEDCEGTRQNVVNCTAIPTENFDVCKTYSYEANENGKQVEHYVKGCGTTEECKGTECKCEVNCCNTDYCNTAWAVKKASGFFVVVCAVMQLLL